jgi:uncharacterized protein YpmB
MARTKKKKVKKTNWVLRLTVMSIVFMLIALAALCVKAYASDPYYEEHMRNNDQTALEQRLTHDNYDYNKNPQAYYYVPISRPGSREYQLKTRGESSIYEKMDEDPMFR